nr:SAM-dependent methyltransferase [Paenibacillus hamazuiensis]
MDSMTNNDKAAGFIATSNHGFGAQAMEEIRRLFEQVKLTAIVPAEIFRFDAEGISKREATLLLTEREPVFVRHVQPVDVQVAIDRTESDLHRLQETVKSSFNLPEGAKVAVQTRKLDGVEYAYTPFACKEAIDEAIVRNFRAEPVVKGADLIISVFLTAELALIGLSAPADNLSDWSGGAVRFQREEGQISRAKFKLLEAEMRFGLDFRSYRNALDIGAAPGGWTSLLLERGCHVTAVDPARLDPGLLQHPKLTFLQKNAGDVRFRDGAFDLLVCDMSWSPRQMTTLVGDLLYAVQPGGTCIITVKLMHKKAFQTMREVVGDLSPQLELQKAKQLFHNREELTMFFIKARS